MKRKIMAAVGVFALSLAGLATPATAGSEWNAKQALPATARDSIVQKPVAKVGEYVTRTLADGSKARVPTAATEEAAKTAAASARRAPTVCTPAPPTVCFHYGTGRRTLAGTQNTGSTAMNVLMSQHKPVTTGVAGNVVYHSLNEVAAIDRFNPGGRNIVEVGWTVDFATNGDYNPHLFVYHWVNNTPTCYNGCGWIDNPGEAVNAGTSLAYTASGSAPSVYYQYRIERTTLCSGGGVSGSGTGWRIGQKNQGAADRIIGCFPDTLWTGATPATSFTAAPEYQAFYEVASQHVETCGDMGSGAFGTGTLPSSGADILAASNGYGTADWDFVFVDPAADTPTAFRVFDGAGYATPDTDRIRGGGPGYNAAGTATGSIGSCQP